MRDRQYPSLPSPHNMSSTTKKYITASSILIAVVVIDQIIKYWVKTNMTLGEHIDITSWFKIAFVENNGFAFGCQLGGKIFLTLFRIVAVSVIGWFIIRQIKQLASMGYIICLSLIMAGAVGNIIDCLFYGKIFTQSTAIDIAQQVSWGQGYGEFLQGRVVDMFYFPLIEWDMPGWAWLYDVPLLPNAYEHCVFFSPVFNFADACISVGVVALILFYHKELSIALKK